MNLVAEPSSPPVSSFSGSESRTVAAELSQSDSSSGETRQQRVKAEVWMLGPAPPPVTGMTLLTQAMVRAMQAAGPVRFLNWSPGMMRRTLRMRLVRNWRILSSLGALLKRGRVRGERVYIVANSPAGLPITALLVYTARKLGYEVYLHHHVYTYIDHYNARMASIDRQIAGHGYHVVHDQKMVDDFRRQYQSSADFLIVHPSVLDIAIGQPRKASHRPFRLGLLSSLSFAKGIDLAIETLEALRNKDRDATLTLAGGIPAAAEKRLIDQAIVKNSGALRYIGPVYDEAKNRFFAEIDALLLPTQTESWGLVLNEALGAGVPVITFDRGCTATVVGTEAGLLVPPSENFVDRAGKQIEQWINDEDTYLRASTAAVAQAQLLHEKGQQTLARFTEHMFSPIGDQSN